MRPGERYRITGIVQPDYDSYALIEYGRGWAVGVGKDWYETNRPESGDGVVVESDGRHLRVDKAAARRETGA